MHIISAQNTHQRPSLRSIFQNFLGGGPPNPPSGRGSPPPTPTPVSALRASKCPYRPLAPCPFQILAGALNILFRRKAYTLQSIVNCIGSKDMNNFLIVFSNKTLIYLQKQSDLSLPCLSRPFWQATRVGNFRTFTVIP